MITQLGFSKELGQMAWSGGGGQSFLGASAAQPADFSAATADAIDREVKKLVERAYRRAKDLISSNINILHKVCCARARLRLLCVVLTVLVDFGTG